jgi:hypothetical protein
VTSPFSCSKIIHFDEYYFLKDMDAHKPPSANPKCMMAWWR